MKLMFKYNITSLWAMLFRITFRAYLKFCVAKRSKIWERAKPESDTLCYVTVKAQVNSI